jgi:hypothetical protein
MKKKSVNAFGNNLPDPFMDSYQQEADTCSDIIDRLGSCSSPTINIGINKVFLQKIIHSHLLHIRELEQDLSGRKYANGY